MIWINPMKRTLLLSTLITAFGLASCGDKKTDPQSEYENGDAAQTSSTDEIRAAAMAANGIAPETTQPTEASGALIGGAAGSVIGHETGSALGGAAIGEAAGGFTEEATENEPGHAELR